MLVAIAILTITLVT